MRTTTATEPRTELSVTEISSFAAMLEQQRGFRCEQLVALLRADVAGPLSSADDEITAVLESGARAALRDVRAALGRISDGTYGRCVQCHAPIGRERLEILPQVAQCVRCRRE